MGQQGDAMVPMNAASPKSRVMSQRALPTYVHPLSKTARGYHYQSLLGDANHKERFFLYLSGFL
jgi:hypothetical protein